MLYWHFLKKKSFHTSPISPISVQTLQRRIKQLTLKFRSEITSPRVAHPIDTIFLRSNSSSSLVRRFILSHSIVPTNALTMTWVGSTTEAQKEKHVCEPEPIDDAARTLFWERNRIPGLSEGRVHVRTFQQRSMIYPLPMLLGMRISTKQRFRQYMWDCNSPNNSM